MRLNVFLSLLLFFCLSAVPTFAAIPLITDDTGTQGKGKFPLELFGEHSHDKGKFATSKKSNLSATLTYGIIDPIDIVLSVPYQVWRTDDSDSVATENGIGDLAFEATWRISEIGDWSFALKRDLPFRREAIPEALVPGRRHIMSFPLLRTMPAKSDLPLRAGELSVRRRRRYITPNGLLIAVPPTPVMKTLSVRGWTFWSFSAAGSVEFIEDFYVVADLGAQTNTDAASSTCPAYFLTGFIYSPAENMDLGLGVIFGLNSAEADYSVRDGITFRF